MKYKMYSKIRLTTDRYKDQDNPNSIGNGTTMDTVRNKIATGKPTFWKVSYSKAEWLFKCIEQVKKWR